MKEQVTADLGEVLADLAATRQEPVAALAEALLKTAAFPDQTVDGPAYREIKERISSLTERYAAQEMGPGKLIDALMRIDTEINGRQTQSWAMRLTPLVAERYAHAAITQWKEKQQQRLAELSPIFFMEKNIAVAIPCGDLGPVGQSRFVDRVLTQIACTKPRRVVLVLKGFVPHAQSDAQWAELTDELAAAKIALVTIEE